MFEGHCFLVIIILFYFCPMPPRYIFNLISGGENETLDFKQEISSVSKISKTIVSFANHKGGKLLVGVKDNKSISGVRSEEEKYMLDMAANFFCKPPIDIQIQEWETDGKIILDSAIFERSLDHIHPSLRPICLQNSV